MLEYAAYTTPPSPSDAELSVKTLFLMTRSFFEPWANTEPPLPPFVALQLVDVTLSASSFEFCT